MTSTLLRSIALYGLLLFYGLTKDELVGRKPLSKFLSIKLIVMFTFYQSFVVRSLRVYHPSDVVTDTHTTTPVVQCAGRTRDPQVSLMDGDERCGRFECTRHLYRGALSLTSIGTGECSHRPAQMVIFSSFMMYAYTWNEYVVAGRPKTGVGRPLLDSINYGMSPPVSRTSLASVRCPLSRY